MAGNENDIAKYLVSHKGKISLEHIGTVKSIGAPDTAKSTYIEMSSVGDVDKFLATQDSRKKADIYINEKGISLKQKGASFLYNRLQRANLVEIFTLLGFKEPASILQCLDKGVENFHKGKIEGRNRPWRDFFDESEFKALVRFLMVQGSPNVGFSSHPAQFILEAPAKNISKNSINVYTFDEYFTKYKDSLKIAIRRQWYGQASDSEHGRSKSLMQKAENTPWVFNNVVGEPNMHRSGIKWRADVSPSDRKTVYFLMIEKVL